MKRLSPLQLGRRPARRARFLRDPATISLVLDHTGLYFELDRAPLLDEAHTTRTIYVDVPAGRRAAVLAWLEALPE